MVSLVTTATQSASTFLVNVPQRKIRLEHKHLHTTYTIESHKYSVFRETTKASGDGETVILVIGFRLKVIHSVTLLHWLFQRICILTTPFWSGLPGFKTKLWMVDVESKNYLGIYDWHGRQQAAAYLEFLLPILNFFSVDGSVWAQQIYGRDFDQYLTEHASATS